MKITKITRTYSASINLRNYSLAEAWIKSEASAEAEVYDGEDFTVAGKALDMQLKKEVTEVLTEEVKSRQK